MDDIRGNPPAFIRSDEQLAYYETIYDDLMINKTPLQFKDRTTLGMLAVSLSIVDLCADSIEDEGMTIAYMGDRKEVTKVNPAVAMMKDAQMAVRHYLKEFGMSPNSRTSGFSLSASAGGSGSGKPDSGDKMSKFTS